MNWPSGLKNKIKLNEALSKHTNFKIGGPSKFWFEPENLDELKEIYNFCQKEKIPLFVLGGGSNILVKDEGWPGMVVKLSKSYFKQIGFDDNLVKAGAGGSLSNLANFALKKSLSGCEFLCGIPGTIGGALIMNAGVKNISSPSQGQLLNISQILCQVLVLDKKGMVKTLKKKSINFGYRWSDLNDYIVLEAKFKFKKGDKEKIRNLTEKFREYKKKTQDYGHPSAGCVFKNPKGTLKSSGQLIDQAGFKGKRIGQAQVSLKHANFIINTGRAKAKDVLALMKNIQEKIKKDCQIWLEPEIKIIG